MPALYEGFALALHQNNVFPIIPTRRPSGTHFVLCRGCKIRVCQTGTCSAIPRFCYPTSNGQCTPGARIEEGGADTRRRVCSAHGYCRSSSTYIYQRAFDSSLIGRFYVTLTLGLLALYGGRYFVWFLLSCNWFTATRRMSWPAFGSSLRPRLLIFSWLPTRQGLLFMSFPPRLALKWGNLGGYWGSWLQSIYLGRVSERIGCSEKSTWSFCVS